MAVDPGRSIEGITWKEFQYYTDIIVAQIRRAEYEPDYIIGIPRGGLPLAVCLSNIFDVPLVYPNKRGLVNKDILIVDDISDTGETLKELIPEYSAMNRVKIATVCYRAGSKVVPDFIGRKLKEPLHHPHYRWIRFPWEV